MGGRDRATGRSLCFPISILSAHYARRGQALPSLLKHPPKSFRDLGPHCNDVRSGKHDRICGGLRLRNLGRCLLGHNGCYDIHAEIFFGTPRTLSVPDPSTL